MRPFSLDEDQVHTPQPAAKRQSSVSGNTENVANYKILRLREMAEMLKGTVLEKHTVILLAMLLQEDGTLTAERRHDCQKNGNCWSIGIMGHHIGHRGTPLIYGDEQKKYYWKWEDRDGDGRFETSPQRAFELDYPDFSTEWRVQYEEYKLRMSMCITSRNTVEECIQSWNSREVGRIAKVKDKMPLVMKALSNS